MKKTVFVTLLMAVSLLAYSQSWTPTQYTQAKGLIADSVLRVPRIDTVAKGGNKDSLGMILYRPADDKYYGKKNGRWAPFTQGTGDLTDYYTKTELQTGGAALVNFANIGGIGTPRLLGRYSPSSGTAEDISIGAGLTLSAGGVLTGLSLNGQTGATQSFSVGTAGTNFNISSNSNNHTFNIPDASATARGLVTTGAQTFAGSKTFGNNINVQNVPAMGSAASTFLTLNGSVLNTRTASQVLSDISGAPATGSTNYIQNSTGTQSSSNFHISGVGQANTQFEVLKNGSSAAAPHYVLKDAGGTDRADLQLTEAATPGMSLWTAGSERMRIESDGDVGIGTTSPSSKLHVSGGPITAAQLQSASGGDLTLWGQGSSQNIIFSAGATSTELMRLTSGGNLGIGVTPAFGSIHIKKNAGAIDVQNTGAYGTNSGGWVYLLNSGTPSAADHKLGAFIFGSAPTDANPKIGAVIDASSDGATWTDGSSHPTYIRFQTVAAGSTALLEKMRILGNGNIVIGCVGCDNGSKLQVGGTTSTQKLIVFTPTAYDQTHTNQKIVRDGTTSELVSYSGDIADYVTLSSSITLGTAEYYIKSNSTAYTVIVPSASANTGRTYLIKNSGNTTNNITVDVTTNAQTIDGVNTNVAITPGVWIRIMSNGTAWFKVGG